MPFRRGAALGAATVLLAALSAATATGATGTAKTPSSKEPAKKAPPVTKSKALWATVDVCSPKNQPDTIGIRASMPGDGKKGQEMYMQFRVQYEDTTTGQWLNSTQADSGYVKIGPATDKALEGGRSFVFKPAAGQTYVLRGAVGFEWRQGGKVDVMAHVHTLAGHASPVGSDPRNYSAASCTIGSTTSSSG
ncbi:MAG TPA: hypothetical protein VHX88_08140 [Solirubrobacteraceae bacterium]|jgi:hypothetical protein|nr:hypothetical protein [Solirubrobacteraceae bacterium]